MCSSYLYDFKSKNEERPVPPDLILYGLIAAGLIFWLRSLLGTRNGEERDRPNPYLRPDGDIVVPNAAADTRGVDGESLVVGLSNAPKGNMSIENPRATDFLIAVARADRGFDIYKFLQAAQDAFVYIVESFADGDRATLKDLLGAGVYDAFDRAITAREQLGHKMHTEIHAISKCDVIEGRFEGRSIAYITLRFHAEETSVTKDAQGEIVHGHPDKKTLMRDVWTFMRDLKARDPRWLVVETRADGAEDNETIPNTH